MKTHRLKVKEVRAIQFTGKNVQEIADFLEQPLSDFTHDLIFGGLIVQGDSVNSFHCNIPLNGWLVFSDNWFYPRVMGNKSFNNTYETIDVLDDKKPNEEVKLKGFIDSKCTNCGKPIKIFKPGSWDCVPQMCDDCEKSYLAV